MTINLELNETEATLLWWNLWERYVAMDARIGSLNHRQALEEAKQEAVWERNQIKGILERLSQVGKDALDLQGKSK